MIVEVFPLGPAETNAYLLGCSKTKQAALIDAPFHAAEVVLKRAQELDLKIVMILITHSHWDHTADAAAVKEQLNIPIYIHQEDSGNLEQPGSDGLPLFFPIRGIKPDGYLIEGQIITVGELAVHIIHTPGHSPGGVCLYLPTEKTLFSGDTLFKGTIGNLSFPTARPTLMWQSLKKLSALPHDTKVYPGHGGATTIGKEQWLSAAEDKFS